MISVPLTSCISKKNGEIFHQINISKDKRIQTTSETIEGIKFIKLYGWEIAFRRIIQKVRELEIKSYKSLSLGRSAERALSNFIGIASGFIMYLASHYSNTGLDLAKMFSCLQVIFSFKHYITYLIVGLGCYYEVSVVCGRFANIFPIKDTSMVEIDP